MKKTLSMLLSAALVLGLATGCSSNKDDSDSSLTPASSAAGSAADTKVSGKVVMSGSTSMEKFSKALNEAFMEKYPGVTATAEFTGSGQGVQAVTEGTIDIGNSSRALTDDEKSKGVVENIVAIDGIAMVVDPANTAANLTKDQIVKIYTGEITNWKDVGGKDQKIVVLGREASSGTRGAFEEIIGLKDKCKYAQEINDSGVVIQKVASTPGAIGYVSLDLINNTVKAVQVEGVEANAENIKSSKYILSRPFVMATKGEISAQSDAVKAFFSYIESDEGKEIIESVGLILPD